MYLGSGSWFEHNRKPLARHQRRFVSEQHRWRANLDDGEPTVPSLPLPSHLLQAMRTGRCLFITDYARKHNSELTKFNVMKIFCTLCIRICWVWNDVGWCQNDVGWCRVTVMLSTDLICLGQKPIARQHLFCRWKCLKKNTTSIMSMQRDL